jgi:hypothetical protein
MKLKSKSLSQLNRYHKLMYCMCIPLFFLSTYVNAQSKLTKPPANMNEYRKTPQYAARKAKLGKATPAPQSKKVTFQDGTELTIILDKQGNSSNLEGPVKKTIGESKKESSGGYDCTTSTLNYTATSSSFLNNDYSGTTANIYPGACYTYANLTNGSWKEQTGARNTLQITTDNPNIRGNSYENVQRPNVGTLETAVNKLFSRLPRGGGEESLTYQVSEATNSAVYNLAIGAAASGYGVDLSNVYSTGNQSNHVHITIDATKILFTISTTPPDSGFFQDPNIEATPYLSYISEISYGVRVLANADITFASEQEADQFRGSISGFGATVSLSVGYGSGSTNTTANINAYIIGGPGGQAVASSLDELKKQIQQAFDGANYQNARPISYKVCDMAGEQLNTYSATDNFTTRSCVPATAGEAEIDNITLTFTQGSQGKSPSALYGVSLFPGMSTDVDPNKAMFIYYAGKSTNSFDQAYASNSTVTVILKPNRPVFDKQGKLLNGFNSKFTLETLQKAGGGHIYISPLYYEAGKYSGQSNWLIDGVAVQINLKPTTANPNPQPIGANSLKWQLQGPNEISLWTGSQNQAFLLFDQNFTQQGKQ